LPLLISVFAVSCHNVLENGQKSVSMETDAGARMGNDVRASISFESETVTFTKTEGEIPEKFVSFYRIQGVPVVSNTKVETLFLLNGLTETPITNLVPTVKIPNGKENIPPDNSPKVSVTKIKNGYASAYDESGKLLSKSEFPVANIEQLNNHLISNPNSVDFDAKIAEFRKKGSIVNDISKGIVLVRTKINTSDYSSQNIGASGSNSEFENISFIDKENKVVVSILLLIKTGKRYRMFF
jgi:hypothetical protein